MNNKEQKIIINKNKKIIFPKDEKLALIRTIEYNKQDCAALARCYNSFKDSDSWPEGFGGSFVFTGEFFERLLENEDLTAWFIANAPDDNTKIIGVSLCNRSWDIHNAWHIALLGVDPAYQGQKYGKALLLLSTQFAMEKKARLIALHTWGGNLKAMPLYKKQGYKWRPDTSVFMENYIPQILNFPIFQEFFSENYWYDVFKPNLTQEPDLEFADKMAIYEYNFEKNNKESIRIWVDRSVARISGFRIRTLNEDLLINAKTPNSDVFIGIESSPVILEIDNQGKSSKKLSIQISSSEQIEVEGSTTYEIEVEPSAKKEIGIICVFKEDTEELDTKSHQPTYSKHEITFTIKMNEQEFQVKVGKNPLYALDIDTYPTHLILASGCKTAIPLEIKNNIKEQKAVRVELTDGNLISFEQHKYSINVSAYDTQLNITTNIQNTSTIVDYVNMKVFSESGEKIRDKDVPIPIFSENTAVTYETSQKILVENKNVRVYLYKEPNPGINNAFIVHKRRNVEIEGNKLVLGYPFNKDGSEFNTKQLEHSTLKDPNGIWLISSAKSDEKKGVRIIRKVFVSNDENLIGVCFELENLTDEKKDNLGVEHVFWWWRGAQKLIKHIFPLKTGIVHKTIHELKADLGNDPSSFTEGWKALVYPSVVLGILFDINKIEKISVDLKFPHIEAKLETLEPRKVYQFPATWFYFTDKWQSVRDKWRELYSQDPHRTLEYSYQTSPMNKIGLSIQEGRQSIARSLIVDKNQMTVDVVIDTIKESTMKGEITVDFDKTNHKAKYVLDNIKTHQWRKEISLPQINKNIISGSIEFNTYTRSYSLQTAVGYYDKSKSVKILTKSEDSKEYLEVDNGFLKFRGSKNHRGNIFYLSIENSENYLISHFPEVKPFLWSSKYFGGIGSSILEVNAWQLEDYNLLNFESNQVQKGLWKGISFKSEIIEYSPKLKGLQNTTNYLTLPDSPFLLVHQEITNHSETTRIFDTTQVGCFTTSKTDKDEYYVSVDGKLTKYNIQDHESQVWNQSDTDTSWTAFKNHDNMFVIGMINQPSNRFIEQVDPYSPNFSVFEFFKILKFVKIKPKEILSTHVLYVFADSTDEIEPFTQSNLTDLL